MAKNSGYENYKKLIDDLIEKISNLPAEEQRILFYDTFKAVQKAASNYEKSFAECNQLVREAYDIESDLDLDSISATEAFRRLLLCKFHAESICIKAEHNYKQDMINGIENTYQHVSGVQEAWRQTEAGRRIYGIKTHLKTNGIYIKTPLCPRKKYYEIRPDGPIILSNPLFTKYISAAIMDDPNYDNYDFSQYDLKTIFLLYVYPKEGFSRGIPDTDNHNSRALINAIAEFFNTGDTALTTSIRAEVILSEEIEPGTYITVLPGTSSHMDSSQVVQFWSQNRL